MTLNRIPIPPELAERLREEPDADELARVWDLLDEAAPAEPPPAEDADWQRVRAATLTSGDEEAPGRSARHRGAADRRPMRRPHRTRRSGRVAWAAALVVAVLVGGGFWLSTPVTVTAPAGALVQTTLPDGSRVDLNSATTLTYPRGFWRLPFVPAERRTVRLRGEAYFDVVYADRPFVVETEDAEVRVLGTAFNVRTRGRGTVVSVEEGRVRVTGDGGRVELEAGARARVERGVPVPTPSAGHTLAWRTRGFSAHAEPLGLILAELERRFAVEIDLRDARAADDTLTLYFPHAADAETILRDVCTARGLRYRATSRGFEVY